MTELYSILGNRRASELLLESRCAPHSGILLHLQLWLPSAWCADDRAEDREMAAAEDGGGADRRSQEGSVVVVSCELCGHVILLCVLQSHA